MQVSGWVAASTWITIKVITFLIIPDKDRDLQNKENNLFKGQGRWMNGEKIEVERRVWRWVFLFVCIFCWRWELLPYSLLSHVQLFVTPWTRAHQASLILTNSWSLPKFMSIELGDTIQPSHASVILFSLCLRYSPASGSFPRSQIFASGGRSIGASASASVLPVGIQGWFPLGLTGLIALQSKGLSRVFFIITIWKYQFFSAQSSLWSDSHIST